MLYSHVIKMVTFGERARFIGSWWIQNSLYINSIFWLQVALKSILHIEVWVWDFQYTLFTKSAQKWSSFRKNTLFFSINRGGRGSRPLYGIFHNFFYFFWILPDIFHIFSLIYFFFVSRITDYRITNFKN